MGSQTIPRGVSAFIGDSAVISAGGNVDLNARERVKMTLVTGNLAGGIAGIGASITILVLDDNEQAFIGQNAAVTAGADVSLDAGLVEDVYGLAAAGQGGVVCLGAQVVVLVDKGDQLAHIDTGAHVHAGGQVKLNATANRTQFKAEAIGGQIGAGAIGASVAVATVEGDTRAYSNGTIGDDTVLGRRVAGHSIQ